MELQSVEKLELRKEVNNEGFSWDGYYNAKEML